MLSSVTLIENTTEVTWMDSKTKHPLPKKMMLLHTALLSSSLDLAREIAEQLQEWNISTAIQSVEDGTISQQLAEFDMAIVLGGDGTMLRAGCLTAPHNIPVLGVNLGRLGFLAEVQPDEWPSVLARVVAGDYWLENRMMLRVTLERNGATIGSFDILNEVFVGRGLTGQPVRIEAHIDNELLATYVADGLIVATPTGSTAYALAVGGPILPPNLKNILLTAVAPHLSLDRSIVLHEGTTVALRVMSNQEAALSADGAAPVMLFKDDWVHVQASPFTSRFVHVQLKSYFYRTLRERIKRDPDSYPNPHQ